LSVAPRTTSLRDRVPTIGTERQWGGCLCGAQHGPGALMPGTESHRTYCQPVLFSAWYLLDDVTSSLSIWFPCYYRRSRVPAFAANLLSSLAVFAAKFVVVARCFGGEILSSLACTMCIFLYNLVPFFFVPPPTSAAVFFFPPSLVTDVPASSRNRRMAVDNSQPFPVSFLFPGPYCIRESRDSRLKLRCYCC
jgi:hypothetical protein